MLSFRHGSLRCALLPKRNIPPSASTEIGGACEQRAVEVGGLAGVGILTSEVKRSEASHEEVKTSGSQVVQRSTILVHLRNGLRYNGAPMIISRTKRSIKSTSYGTHYFGTFHAVVFVTRPGQAGRFLCVEFWRKDS